MNIWTGPCIARKELLTCYWNGCTLSLPVDSEREQRCTLYIFLKKTYSLKCLYSVYPICLSCLSVCLCLFMLLSVFVSVSVTVFCVCLCVCVCVCVCVCLSVCLSVFLSLSLSLSLSGDNNYFYYNFFCFFPSSIFISTRNILRIFVCEGWEPEPFISK